MKVGLLIDKFNDWYGGADFVLLLLNGLRNSELEYEIIIRNNREHFIGVLKRIIRKRPSNYEITKYLVDNLQSNEKYYFFRKNEELQRLVQKNNIDVLFPVFDNKILTSSKNIGYIYDLQHKYYPEYFSSEEILAREIQFTETLVGRPAVIVNAHSVKNDIVKFYGSEFANKVKVLPFTAKNLVSSQKIVTNKDRYFVVSNQFWRHKDHLTAIRAFQEFIQITSKSDYKLYLTGVVQDYRSEEHIEEIRDLITEINLTKEHVILTGFLSSKHLIDLIANATGLIQPTHFEGGRGGGSTPFALSLGTPCILSDIDVNLELKSLYGVEFFITADSSDLCATMISMSEHCYDAGKISNQLTQSANELGNFFNTMFESSI